MAIHPADTMPDLRHVAVTESPLLAWLDEVTWNWTCEECGTTESCAHLAVDEDAVAVLAVLRATLGAHRSTSRVVEALGGEPGNPGAHECQACEAPWPCAAIVDAEKANRPLIERWLADQPWWGSRWVSRHPSARLGRAFRLPEGTLAEDGHNYCPYCGEDVTDGIEEWRAAVRHAFAYATGLRARLEEGMERAETVPAAMPAEWRAAFAEGLRAAEDHAGTEMNRLLHSHHAHIDFCVAERDSGAIPQEILI